ncbi:FAD/NAD(P)-binding domain-containing protein [Neoconidiobolus thromboides FSU 785]|nr:FAD/NAD(P)-binding domain-containing protein [Neoconidiobolus thromboides FSU 785]
MFTKQLLSVVKRSQLNKQVTRSTTNLTNKKWSFFNGKKQVPIVEVEGVKLYPPRTTGYRIYRTSRILFKALVVLFIASGSYVVINEYFEDLKHKRTLQDHKLHKFDIDRKEGEAIPTAVWPKNEKPKLVILGSGWGSVGLLKQLDVDKYEVLVISPSNYFQFTPLLPSVTVGTVEPRSLIEPIRKILRRFGDCGHYFQGLGMEVDIENNRVLVQNDQNEPFYVPYDHLVVAVGSKSITFGIQGLEHAHFLHDITDARKIRTTLLNNLEKASLPNIDKEERKKLLSFVVCGGGPTGVEFAAELEDLLITDLASYFPFLAEDVSIHIIQSREHILNTYDEQISKYTEKRFKDRNINIITNARVKELKEDSVVYTLKNDKGEVETYEIPYGLVLWSTGIAVRTLVEKIKKQIEEQTRSRALTVDGTLRVKGKEDGSIFALGDCASVEIPKILERMKHYFETADKNKDGYLNFQEFKEMCHQMIQEVPRASAYIPHLLSAFKKYDVDHSNSLDLSEVQQMILDIDSKMTSLPATAQVANQQGKYLAKLLNSLHNQVYGNQPITMDNNNHTLKDIQTGKVVEYLNQYPKFTYKHLGSLAYIGNSAVAELETNSPTNFQLIKPKVILAGFSAMYLWRSIYWSEQVSARNRMLLSLDWSKRILFGRDLSRL